MDGSEQCAARHAAVPSLLLETDCATQDMCSIVLENTRQNLEEEERKKEAEQKEEAAAEKTKRQEGRRILTLGSPPELCP